MTLTFLSRTGVSLNSYISMQSWPSPQQAGVSLNSYISMLCWPLLTVSGQNTIGIYITPLVLIQPTDVEQNAVNNNWLLKLQPAVKLQSWQKSNFHQIE